MRADTKVTLLKLMIWVILIGLFVCSGTFLKKVVDHHSKYVIHTIVSVFLSCWFLFKTTLRNIPNDPPSVGVAVLLGKRQPGAKVIKEGWHIFLPWWDIFTAVLVPVLRVNHDFEFTIRTVSAARPARNGGRRSGPKIKINASITYSPDYTSAANLITYLNVGQKAGVEDIIRDVIAEVLRQEGARTNWEEYQFSGREITGIILEKLVDQAHLTQREQRDGVPMLLLGIRIFKFNLGEIEVLGKAAESVDDLEKEELQRRGEHTEMDFIQEQLAELIAKGLSPAEAAEVLQVERKKATKEIRSYRGLEEVGTVLGGAIVKFLSRK